MRESIIFLSLLYAAWSDLRTGQIPDLCSFAIALCSSSWLPLLRGLCLASALQLHFVSQKRCGSADPLLLGSLMAALPSDRFAALCVLSTALFAFQGPQKSQPLAPYILSGYLMQLVLSLLIA